MNNVIFTRQKLYNLVWSEPVFTISKKYVISDAGLRNICIKMSIPFPREGHWTKSPADRPVPAKLPSSYVGEHKVTLQLRGGRTNIGGSNSISFNELKSQIEIDSKLSLIDPGRLGHKDKLIIAAKERLSGKGNYGRYKGVVSSWGDTLDIRVSPKNVSRALCFMDTLIKVLRARGQNVIIKNGNTYVDVDDYQLKIYFRERLKRVVVNNGHWDSSELHATGMVYFKIDDFSGKEWKDGRQALEEQIPAIIAKLETLGKEHKERQAAWKREREENEERERIKRERIDRQKQEMLRFKGLLEEASRWREATMLRQYIYEMELKGGKRGMLKEEFTVWLDWAKAKADWDDPNVEKEDEILGIKVTI